VRRRRGNAGRRARREREQEGEDETEALHRKRKMYHRVSIPGKGGEPQVVGQLESNAVRAQW
jgi:hypothetical protein